MNIPSLPLRQFLPARLAGATTGSPVQQAFRQAIGAVEELREQLRSLREQQAATRQAYWRQVGPLAAATVAARRALYEPLETALTSGYLSRAEAQQVAEVLWRNAHSLQERFGEEEAAILARYAPAPPPPDPVLPATAQTPTQTPAHEQAAATARERRQQRAQQARAAQARAADTEGQALLQNTKAAYRQLARLHHPDRAAQGDAATQQAQTELMQRITAAYSAGDLAALLTLLAETDSTASANSEEADALFGRYTAALAQQQVQLSQQLALARQPLDSAPWSGTEKQQRTRLRELKRSLRAETEYLLFLLRQLQEPATLRQLLRELAASGQAGF
ncbi:J domain-containing protein [Hymenobacter sp. H14-R3]|uniref:J domain-containing protein n=1 Tax=Hymenobacter sp. H14-R3 TaxID=3046308 RepID=UPI0024B9016E|nr:J domain-containing protein [Hymenobacter sp. H14-R3]MDJ0367217.1 J domain-containing protein [Hymenobacter sp. H14-R3]